MRFLPGVPLTEVELDADIARDLGVSLAKIGRGLAQFSHEAERQTLLWDLQQAPQLKRIVSHIDDEALRDRVSRVLDDYESRVAAKLSSLRQQVIHNDANPGNILLGDVLPGGMRRIAGIIDFGDLVRAPLINDVAVAASYLRTAGSDTLEFILPFVDGYHRTARLDERELCLLFDLVRTRLATTVTILWWRLSARDPQDPYRLASQRDESDAGRFLAALDAMGRAGFNKRLLDYLHR
jgi:Ser/Thr protein kinase RdoA (MazF antagonist)